VKSIKYVLLFLFVISISYQAHSQKRAVTFYDSAWALTSKERGVYYRVGIIDTLHYQYYGEVAEFYKNGKRLMRGNFKASIKQDTFFFYYPSGQLETKGVYRNNVRKGIWTNYYESGSVKERLEFDDEFVAVKEYYDENGTPKIVDGNGEWKAAYDVEPTKVLSIKGNFVAGRRSGEWTYQLVDKAHGDATLYCTETFKDGQFTSGKMYADSKRGESMDRPQMFIYPELTRMRNWDKWEVTPYVSRKDYPYLSFLGEDVEEIPPSYKGGLAAMAEFVGKNLHYPPDARQKGKQGTVFVTFHINADGTIDKESVSVLKSVYPSLDAEAVRVVKKLPPWIPATKLGKPVRSQSVMPIKFLLGL
jgi:TonB family protein